MCTILHQRCIGSNVGDAAACPVPPPLFLYAEPLHSGGDAWFLVRRGRVRRVSLRCCAPLPPHDVDGAAASRRRVGQLSGTCCLAAMVPSWPRLDTAQVEVARCVLGGHNVAAVGAAGCGKSTLISLVVDAARQRWGESAVSVLAWTGSAAQLVGGKTVSSFLRVSVGDVSKERILSRILANTDARRAIEAVRLVVIDEAPTIPGRWFDRLEYVFRRVAPPTLQCRPFGGRTVFGTSRPAVYPSRRRACFWAQVGSFFWGLR